MRRRERWWLDLIPRPMRVWPWLRRYYWQADELARIADEGQRLGQLFKEEDRHAAM